MLDVLQISLPQTDYFAPKVNVYLLKKLKLLIDAGPANLQSFKLLETILAENNLSFNELNGIILTHHHNDHIGLLKFLPHTIPVFCDNSIKYYGSKQFLRDISRVIAELKLPEKIKNELISHLRSRYCPFINNYQIFPIENLPLLSYVMRGHSALDNVIQFKDMLFTGDLILKGIYFNNLLDLYPKTRQIQKNQANDFIESLSKIKK